MRQKPPKAERKLRAGGFCVIMRIRNKTPCVGIPNGISLKQGAFFLSTGQNFKLWHYEIMTFRGRPRSKVDDNILLEIKNLYNEKKSISSIAQKYSIDRATVYYYLGKTKKTPAKFNIFIKKPLERKLQTKEKKQIKKVKMYKDYLAEENAKRKAKGFYLFKISPLVMKSGKWRSGQSHQTVNLASQKASLVQIQPSPNKKEALASSLPAPAGRLAEPPSSG